MNAVGNPCSNSLRNIATALSFLLLANQFADAAWLSPQQAPTTQSPAPVVRDAPLTPAPVPVSIASAHTIFLVNMGADPNFPGSAPDSYNAVYAALQAWGHYQLVSSPGQADLILQLREVAPITNIAGYRGAVQSYTSPAFQLTILDAKTQTPLWTVNSPVNLSRKKKEYASWFALSVTNLVSRVKVVAGVPLTPTETAELTTFPKYHFGRTVAIVSGGFLVLTAGTYFLAKHFYDQNVAAQHAAFCKNDPFPCPW